jgi:GNAT superfamily N-acetyltransferase
MATKTQTVTVRKGTAADGETLADLICALAEYEKLPRPDKQARERLKRDAFGNQPRFETWFAEVNGKSVGYAITFYTYSTFLALPSLYLEDIFVLPEYRSQKIGKALFVHCVKLALQENCGRMEWQVLHWNTPALEFYRSIGATRLEGWQPYRMVRGDLEQVMA